MRKDTLTIKEYKPQKTYAQNWPAYNQAQMQEKILLIHTLNELLTHTPLPERVKSSGRKPIPMRDKIFYIILQAYNIKSSRRCIADLELCKQMNYTNKAPHFNTILNILKDPEIEPYLKHLIHLSGIPLTGIEEDFAIDSSGFSTSQYDRWQDVRTNKYRGIRRFRKAHITCGVKTNIITSINITRGPSADCTQLKTLINKTNQLYTIKEVSADGAYSSRANLQTIQELGATGFIPFSINATSSSKGIGIWNTMFNYYHKHTEEFLKHYHKRSNVETCFHMIKNKFGTYTRSKNNTGQNNEILAKCLCHNLCVLIQESFELNIQINFKKCAKHPIAQ